MPPIVASMWRMRFNEKELIAMASSKSFTIEGILWKRPKLGHQYRDRFCRLKNNLLFYFTVNTIVSIDGSIQKQRCGDLLGLVVIENMVVQELPMDERHLDQKFGFFVYYRAQETDNNIPAKIYEFRCSNREIQRFWMECLNRCSYSSLRRHYIYLQNEFVTLNVDLPPELVRFHNRSPKVTFSNIQTLVPKGRPRVNGACCTPRISVRKLPDIDLPLRRACTYVPKRPENKGLELQLSCSNLIPYPNVGYFVDVTAGSDKENLYLPITRTETIYNDSNPNYCSTVLLDKEKYLSNKTLLTFSIKQVHQEKTDIGVEISIVTLHKASVSISKLSIKEKIVIMTEDGKACLTIKPSKLITALHSKPQKFYEKFHKHFHDANFCTQRTPCDLLLLNPLYLFPIRKTYELPANHSIPMSTIRAIEVSGESPYNNIIPIEYLKLCLRDNKNICSDFVSLGPLLSELEIRKEQLIAQLEQQIVQYHTTIEELIELQYFFHASSKRENPKLSFLPINLHVHKFLSINETPPNLPSKDPATRESASNRSLVLTRTHSDNQNINHSISTLSYVSMGAPTHHAAGFKKGSILTMLRKSRHLPFYVFADHNRSRNYTDLADDLSDCLYQFTEYKDFLMRTVANTAFTISQEALAGLSSTMQRMFTVLESVDVQEGISEYNQLTSVVSSETIPVFSPHKKSAVTAQERFEMENKKLDYSGRYSWYSGQISDQLERSLPPQTSPAIRSKRSAQARLSYRDKQTSILQNYIELAEKVDNTSAHIISMREKIADLSGQGMLSSSKIEFVSWSEELIPLLSMILLRINKVQLTAKKGLTLKRLEYESPIENYVEMLERHDVIMSQILTCLVTSFAQSFQAQVESNNPASSTNFLKKCYRIGYLFCVESFLSVIGSEKFMHEDLAFGVQQLSSVNIRLSCGCCHDHPEVTGSRTNITIILPICPGYYRAIPVSLRERDIPIYPLLFSRSVYSLLDQSEIQSSAYQFFASTNKQSIHALKRYYELYEENKDILTYPLTNKAYIFGKLNAKLSSLNFNSKFSNIYDMELFHLVEQATRELEGGTVTMCKSAKDRTASATTLQQALFLQDTYTDTFDEQMKERLLSVMRMSGTKLDICAKNTNKSLFAFNPQNLHLLPPALVPPVEVCGKTQMT